MNRTPNAALHTFLTAERADLDGARWRAKRDGQPIPVASLATAAASLAAKADDEVEWLTRVPAAQFRDAFAMIVAAQPADLSLDDIGNLFPICFWLSKDGYTEDGDENIVECRANVTVTDRGWTCDAGHEHVSMEARHNEGWDYAEDAEEAANMRKYGIDAVGMDGGSI